VRSEPATEGIYRREGAIVTDLDQLQQAALAISPHSTVDEACDVISRIDAAMERAKELRATLEQVVTEWVKENGPLMFGTIRFYLGTEKKVICKGNKECLEAMLRVCGGDVEAVAKLLGSGAFKYGSVRTTLEMAGVPEKFDELFETTEKEELKEGKPEKVKKLRRVDEKFLSVRGEDAV
jgi:hypothetical protein